MDCHGVVPRYCWRVGRKLDEAISVTNFIPFLLSNLDGCFPESGIVRQKRNFGRRRRELDVQLLAQTTDAIAGQTVNLQPRCELV